MNSLVVHCTNFHWLAAVLSHYCKAVITLELIEHVCLMVIICLFLNVTAEKAQPDLTAVKGAPLHSYACELY